MILFAFSHRMAKILISEREISSLLEYFSQRAQKIFAVYRKVLISEQNAKFTLVFYRERKCLRKNLNIFLTNANISGVILKPLKSLNFYVLQHIFVKSLENLKIP